jgi:hypothetical protein
MKLVEERAQDAGTPNEILDGRLAATLASARGHFVEASRQVDSPVLAPVRLLPFVGRQLRSAIALADAAVEVTDIGVDAAGRAEDLADRPIRSGPERVTIVRSLAELAAETERRLTQVDLGPREALIAPLARVHNKLTERLTRTVDGLQGAAAGAEAVADLLAGPHRYLVLVVNNAEMRAGSGMVLSVGELETADGTVRFGGTRSVAEVVVPPGTVSIEGDLADRWGWLKPQETWQNLMLSPRFDVNASLAARMWEAAGNRPVDGVLALDPVALRGVLEATGPLDVDGTVVTAENVLLQMFHDQYLEFDGEQRYEAMGRVAEVAFAALDGGRWSFPGLVAGLAGPLRSRHLMVWSSDPAQQEGWRRTGVDGTIRPDSLLVSVLNRGGNKLDFFLQVTSDLACRPAGDELDCTIRLGLENTVPVGESTYIAGPYLDNPVAEGTYVGIVAVTLPGAAADGRIEGVEQLAVAGPDGPSRVVGYQLEIPRGERREVTVRFRLPGPHPVVRIESSARVPNVAWTGPAGSWLDSIPMVVTL